MDCYSFTYKDVLKRYERIINKPSKFEIRLLATILLIITIVNITSLCFASEGTLITGTFLEGVFCSVNSNVFSSGRSLTYYPVKKGFKYQIERLNTEPSEGRCYVFSSEFPQVNKPYTLIGSLAGEGVETFTYLANDDGYICIDWGASNNYSVTEFEVESYEKAVSGLVDNVGPSQIWDIFNTGIGFVGVVVLVSFGIFIIVIAIKKVSKGKSDF